MLITFTLPPHAFHLNLILDSYSSSSPKAFRHIIYFLKKKTHITQKFVLGTVWELTRLPVTFVAVRSVWRLPAHFLSTAIRDPAAATHPPRVLLCRQSPLQPRNRQPFLSLSAFSLWSCCFQVKQKGGLVLRVRLFRQLPLWVWKCGVGQKASKSWSTEPIFSMRLLGRSRCGGVSDALVALAIQDKEFLLLSPVTQRTPSFRVRDSRQVHLGCPRQTWSLYS